MMSGYGLDRFVFFVFFGWSVFLGLKIGVSVVMGFENRCMGSWG